MSQLHALKAGDKFYQGADSLGGLLFRQPLLKSGTKLPYPASIALALTELCCERGSGKVYVFSQADQSPAYRAQSEAFEAWARLPDLLYLLYVWSDEEKQEWQSLKPSLQLERLYARRGFINDEMPLVPISLGVVEEAFQNATLSAYTMAPVTILLGPEPYVLYTKDARAQYTEQHTKKDGEIMHAILEGPKTLIASNRVNGGIGILEALEKIAFSGPEECLSTYAVEIGELIKAGVAQKNAGQPYGLKRAASIGGDA